MDAADNVDTNISGVVWPAICWLIEPSRGNSAIINHALHAWEISADNIQAVVSALRQFARADVVPFIDVIKLFCASAGKGACVPIGQCYVTQFREWLRCWEYRDD